MQAARTLVSHDNQRILLIVALCIASSEMLLAACRAEAFRLISGEVLPARTFIGRLMVSRTGCDSV
jgi:hypothetical protein